MAPRVQNPTPEMLQEQELTFREKMTTFFDALTLRIPAGVFWTSACLIVLISVIFTLSVAERRSERQVTSASVIPTPAEKPAATTRLELGDVRTARANIGNKVILASDGTALDDLASALPESREAVASRLLAQGRAFQIDRSAKVLIVGFGFAEVKVRVMEGTNRDRTGWASQSMVE